jgi:hypothetical protein
MNWNCGKKSSDKAGFNIKKIRIGRMEGWKDGRVEGGKIFHRSALNSHSFGAEEYCSKISNY